MAWLTIAASIFRQLPSVSEQTNPSRFRRVKLELVQLLWFLLIGLVLLPLAIYLVGDAVFGTYAGSGFGGFYANLHSELRAGQPVVVFLLLSPYLVWMLLRATIWGFRRSAAKNRSAEV